MITKKVKVSNEHGIHVRPSSIIIMELKSFPGTTIEFDKGDGPSVLDGLLTLIAMGIDKGDEVTVTATGDNEQGACDRFAQLLEFNFDFQR